MADGYFTQKTFRPGALALGLSVIGKLRKDASIFKLYQGKKKGRGRPKKYGSKLDFQTPRRGMKYRRCRAQGLDLYWQDARSKHLGVDMRVVVVRQWGKEKNLGILYSSDLSLDTLDNELGTLHRDDSALSADEVTRRGVARLEQLTKADKPFFLWLHYFDPHGFYIYKDGLTPWLDQVENPILRGYAQEVWRTDNQIGAFLAELERRGVAKDAIIVVFSDHGEALGEDGLTDHGWHATESILRVPFAIKLPGSSPREIKEPVSLLDLTPTLIDALQIQNTEPRPGSSLLGVMRGEKLAPRPIFVSATYRHRPVLWTVIDYPWKLTFDRMRWTFRLQNAEEDPNALTDVSSNHPEVFEHLKNEMGTWRDRHFHDRFIEQKANRLKQRGATIPTELKGEIYAPQLQ